MGFGLRITAASLGSILFLLWKCIPFCPTLVHEWNTLQENNLINIFKTTHPLSDVTFNWRWKLLYDPNKVRDQSLHCYNLTSAKTESFRRQEKFSIYSLWTCASYENKSDCCSYNGKVSQVLGSADASALQVINKCIYQNLFPVPFKYIIFSTLTL